MKAFIAFDDRGDESEEDLRDNKVTCTLTFGTEEIEIRFDKPPNPDGLPRKTLMRKKLAMMAQAIEEAIKQPEGIKGLRVYRDDKWVDDTD